MQTKHIAEFFILTLLNVSFKQTISSTTQMLLTVVENRISTAAATWCGWIQSLSLFLIFLPEKTLNNMTK